jgi:hypothetical protein
MPADNTTQNRFVHHISIVATTLVWLFSVYIIVTSILTVHNFYCPLPYGDMWWFVRDMAEFRSHRIGLSFLWKQHSEHRLVVPRLIFWVDLQFFRFRGVFTIVCSLLLQVGEAMLLCLAFWRAERNSPVSRLSYAALVFGMMFSASQIENLIFPFQIQFPLAFFMASVSIVLVLHHCEANGGDWISIFLGLVAATCATLSLGCGLLVWPVLVLICIIERAPRMALWTTGVAGISIWISYFIGYLLPSQSANPWLSLRHPVRVSAFTVTFLASALTTTPSRFAGLFGLVFLSGTAVGFFLYVRVRSKSFWKARSFFVYLSVFIVVTALLTSLGRLNSGLDEAATIRYRMPTLIFWACIIGLGSSLSGAATRQIVRLLGGPLLALLFVALFLVPTQQSTIEEFAQLTRQISDDSIDLSFNVTDQVYGRLFRIRPDLVRSYAPFLKENHLSIFADRLLTAWGEPLTDFFADVSSHECSGSVDRVEPTEETARQKGAVFGWGWVATENRGPETVILADDRHAIVGLARGLEPRPDISAHFRNPKMLATGWSGYYHLDSASQIMTGYAILPDGKTLCPLGQVDLQP